MNQKLYMMYIMVVVMGLFSCSDSRLGELDRSLARELITEHHGDKLRMKKLVFSEEGFEKAKNDGLYIKNDLGYYVLTPKGIEMVGVPVKKGGENWLSSNPKKRITLEEPIRGVVDEITGIRGSENLKLVEYTIKPVYPSTMSNIQNYLTTSDAEMKFEKYDDGWRKK